MLSFFDFYGRKGKLMREHVDEMNDVGKHIITEKLPIQRVVEESKDESNDLELSDKSDDKPVLPKKRKTLAPAPKKKSSDRKKPSAPEAETDDDEHYSCVPPRRTHGT